MSSRAPVKEPPDAQLIAGARKAVEQHGYAGLTLERIAGEADVSRVTLHRRGYSKDEIFGAVVTQMFEEHRDALWPALVDGGNGAERLNLAVATVCDLCERDLMLLLEGAMALTLIHGGRAYIDAAAQAARRLATKETSAKRLATEETAAVSRPARNAAASRPRAPAAPPPAGRPSAARERRRRPRR